MPEYHESAGDAPEEAVASSAAGEKVKTVQVAPRPGEPFRNPLPVPKRHVRRDRGYSLEPAPERMCYDILPPEEDDFDL